jgi:hypothetical protein
LHYQERYLEKALAEPKSNNYAKAFYLPTEADTYVSELHKWINRYDADPFAGEQLAEPLVNEVLLDRYHSHTSKCASCSQALRNVRKLKTVSKIVAAIAWTSSPLISYFFAPANLTLILLGAIPAAIAIAIWLICNNLERKFTHGQETPLRNL